MVSLNKNRQFKRAYKKGRFLSNRFLVIYFVKNFSNVSRMGITVSKKLGCAVKRNRVKRLIKEVFRKIEHNVSGGFDIVFLVREISDDTCYANIEKSVSNLLTRSRLI